MNKRNYRGGYSSRTPLGPTGLGIKQTISFGREGLVVTPRLKRSLPAETDAGAAFSGVCHGSAWTE